MFWDFLSCAVVKCLSFSGRQLPQDTFLFMNIKNAWRFKHVMLLLLFWRHKRWWKLGSSERSNSQKILITSFFWNSHVQSKDIPGICVCKCKCKLEIHLDWVSGADDLSELLLALGYSCSCDDIQASCASHEVLQQFQLLLWADNAAGLSRKNMEEL